MPEPETPQTQTLRETAEDVLTCLAWSDEWGRKVLPHINLKSWATDTIYRNVAEKLIKHWHKFDRPPLGHVSTLFARELEGEKARQYESVLRQMHARSKTAQFEFVIDAVQEHERCNLAISGAWRLAEAAMAGDSEGLDRALGEIRKVDGAPGRITTRTLDKFERKKLKWMWWPFFPRTVCLLYGDGGKGKSTIALDLAARITRGRPWPKLGREEAEKARAGSVVILSAEEDPETIIRPKMEAAGADLTKVYFLGREKKVGGSVDFYRIDRIDTNLGVLEELVKQIGDVRMIEIDPVSSFMGDLDMNSDAAVRTVLDPLNNLATKYSLTVILILHLNKKSDLQARARAIGSGAFINASRSAMLVGDDPDDSSRKIMTVVKNNHLKEGKPYTIGFETVEGRDGSIVLQWGKDWLDHTADDILSKPKGDTKARKAVELITELLEDGPMQAKEIFEIAKTRDIGERTLKKAKTTLHINTRKRDGHWYWQLSQKK